MFSALQYQVIKTSVMDFSHGFLHIPLGVFRTHDSYARAAQEDGCNRSLAGGTVSLHHPFGSDTNDEYTIWCAVESSVRRLVV